MDHPKKVRHCLLKWKCSPLQRLPAREVYFVPQYGVFRRIYCFTLTVIYDFPALFWGYEKRYLFREWYAFCEFQHCYSL